jgi:hypothetical protein
MISCMTGNEMYFLPISSRKYENDDFCFVATTLFVRFQTNPVRPSESDQEAHIYDMLPDQQRDVVVVFWD